MKRSLAAIALGAQVLRPLEPKPDLHLAVGVIAQHALDRPVAGISVAVAPNGIFTSITRGFGFADVDRKIPVTPDTVFHIASISKQIAAAAALTLVEGGALSLDDDVTKYVPEAPTHGQRVTIRQLLNHTSGLYSFTSLPDADANERLDLSHAQVLALIKDRPLDFAPGTSWRYNNTGFYLVGMVVEKIAGQPYATYLRDHIFRPLGMNASSLCTSHDAVPSLASGHVVKGGALVAAPAMTWTLPFAGGAVCATAADLLKWQRAVPLAGGPLARDRRPFLSRQHVEEMRTPTVLADGTRIDYGLGTRIGSLQGHAVTGHTGSGGGFSTVLMNFPGDALTIVVLTNSAGGGAAKIAASIARSAFEIGPPALADLPVPSDEAAALTGTFDSDEGPIENYTCGDKLCSRPPGAAEGLPLRRQAPFTYAIDADTLVRFTPASASAEWAFVYSGGLMADAKRRVRRP